jgi:hypothetical protein
MTSPDDGGDDAADELVSFDDERRRVPADTYAKVPGMGPLVIGPDGVPKLGGIGQPAPLPPRTAEHFICLRGPCRHFWQLQTHLVSGNPSMTWDPEVGLRPIKQCPTCGGRALPHVAPALALSSTTACGHTPTQGKWSVNSDGQPTTIYPCRLVAGHEGAHHHDPNKPPAPQPVKCPECDDSGYIVDLEGPVVKEPKQHTLSCMLQPGIDTDLTDDNVYDCTHWDPLMPKELAKRDKRRREYLKRHPEHATKE